MALPALIALPLCILFLWALGRWALAPLRHHALDPRPPVQYLLTDMYVLVIQMLAVGLAVFELRPAAQAQIYLPTAVGFWLVLAWSWWLTVRWLSHAGVADRARRGLTLALAAPLGFIAFPLAALGPLVLVRFEEKATATKSLRSWFWLYGLTFPADPDSASRTGLIISACLLITAAGVFVACRRIARWAVSQRKSGRTQAA